MVLLCAALVIGASKDLEEPPVTNTSGERELPRPRDGNVAIREELDQARRLRTRAAYDLFIARHPEHPLAEIARRERAVLAAGRRD